MSKNGKFVLGVAVGAAIGVIAGWFTAPKSGKEMRADAKNKTKEIYEDVRDKSEDFIDDAKAIVRLRTFRGGFLWVMLLYKPQLQCRYLMI